MTENPQDRDPDVQLDRSDTEQESRQMDITLPKSDILQLLVTCYRSVGYATGVRVPLEDNGICQIRPSMGM
jgi:hypothetical protein